MKGRDVILGILRNKPRTGYEINDILQNQISYFYDGTYGMIYPTLKKLEKEGKVKRETVIQEDKPNKNIFSITDEGKEELKEYLESNKVEEVFKSDFLMKLFFGDDLSKQKVIELIKSEIKVKEDQIKRLEDSLEHWEVQGINNLQKITVGYGLTEYRAVVKYLKEQLKKLED
ncbi:PadR family transcriptional regulator [Limosilactobacillus reuteri]|uniref:Transcriptional regulator, PadR-like family n=1 Tax=Limosilactobacillus reuteri subsp. rodentium (strain DSM 17509 / CIP 109821 / 100-23) TaxID=349123 RepID=B3XP74_LIMR1|nr:PadR family transcriptional regulator [Limosilactobacillus reuteri]EDX42831.1 transcriptional regulator, PadR-like family [Limosilactobacillus reuteri subsp. rodentium]KGE70325.1 PadR family transcriptional regulator [Limosilactobacillus reuteri]MCC4331320.1 PadR family transcriptional regulator [Limosilactobacillus reuteri]MCC4353634.1 PadR family transcriptional regulator [Limosilactobacillus reuteri]MCC4474872.1 PadR family transcriptional regulator [Limosilactobacillus reuteri]